MKKKQQAAAVEGSDDGAATPGTKSAGNGYDSDLVTSVVIEIEDHQSEIDAIMQKAKDMCSPLREHIGEIKKTANSEHHIPRKELNSLLQKRRLLAKAEAVRENLSADQKDEFDLLWHAMAKQVDLFEEGAAQPQEAQTPAATIQ